MHLAPTAVSTVVSDAGSLSRVASFSVAGVGTTTFNPGLSACVWRVHASFGLLGTYAVHVRESTSDEAAPASGLLSVMASVS